MRLGFIGAGNMGSAIIEGILKRGYLPACDILISRKRPELSSDFALAGVRVLKDNTELVKSSDAVVLAIKPVYAEGVIQETFEALKGRFVISIMAGWSFEMLQEALPKETRFMRVMPNTPLSVGEGMTLISNRYTCTDGEFAFGRGMFETAGKVAVVEDRVFTPANGISGCGPAFVYQFIEALADGGVRYGVPRALAYELAAQTLIGAAKMVQEKGEHPGTLKDNVCSPGGTTIEGIYALERGGMRAAVMDAVGATVEKNNRLMTK